APLHFVVDCLLREPCFQRRVTDNFDIRAPSRIPFDDLARQILLETPLGTDSIVAEKQALGDDFAGKRINSVLTEELIRLYEAVRFFFGGKKLPEDCVFCGPADPIEGKVVFLEYRR